MSTNRQHPYVAYMPPGFYFVPVYSSSSSSGSPPSSLAWSLSPSGSIYSPVTVVLPGAPRSRTVPLPWVVEDVSRPKEQRPSRAPAAPHRPPFPQDVQPPSPDQTSIEPLIALPQRPNSKPWLAWDLMHPPSTALREISSLHLSRPAVWSGGRPLQSVVLTFLYLSMEIEIKSSQTAREWGQSTPLPYVTLRNLLDGLYHGLRAPIEQREVWNLGQSEQVTLSRAAETRRRLVPEGEGSRHALRRIDYLGGKRRFVGIRPAHESELPKGRKIGEVFVVHVCADDR